MEFRVLFLVLPSFIIVSCALIYILFIELHAIFLGIIFSIISIFIGLTLFKEGFHSYTSHFEDISKNTVDIEKVEITFEDGVKSVGLFYRLISETISTPNGRRYSESRPTIIIFHGYWNKKESNERILLPFAQMGYVAFSFDQRGHGEAGGKKNEWYKRFNDIDTVLNLVCSYKDVRNGSLCCIGTSMGGTSVLTKCYQDDRVAMVVALSALHDIKILMESKFPFLSQGWFVKKMISKVKNERAMKITAHYFIKKDPNFNKNRVYLIHAKNDKIFPPSLTFNLNKKQAGIPEKQAILLDNCGHSLDGQESLIFGIITKWILQNESMKLKENPKKIF
ncbi:MAG: alpha/beta hydrolase [Promethearchaeota archaeon]